jgi:molybdopterin-guanine dinucleotide biosynthesis protein A
MWTAAILAGGQAQRLGGCNKGALHLGCDAILDRQVAVLRAVVDRLVIVATDDAPYRPYGVPILRDLVPGAGPLGAIYTAIQSAPAARTLIVACDMPFLSVPFLTYLVAAGRDVDIAIPRTASGYEPLCATYSGRCARPLQSLIEAKRFKVLDVLADTWGLTVRQIGPAELVPFDRDETLFFNVNTPDDYARALDLAAEYRSHTG